VIIFHPRDNKINMVFSGFLVLISWWGASHNRVSWWAGCTTCWPPAVEIYYWKWRGISCIIPSETGSLQRTAGAVNLRRVESRRLSISRIRRNQGRLYCGQYRRSCSASTSGTSTPQCSISPWLQWGRAWDHRCCRPNTNIWSAFDRCTPSDQYMV